MRITELKKKREGNKQGLLFYFCICWNRHLSLCFLFVVNIFFGEMRWRGQDMYYSKISIFDF